MFERGWIDVNLGMAFAANRSVAVEITRPRFSETENSRTTYENPTGASFDFGGGVMFTPNIGAGVSVVGTAHQAAPRLFVSVPHPNVFDASASDTVEAEEEFQRLEGSTRVVGVGAFVRFSRGTVEMVEPLADSDIELRVGGLQTGGGLRLKF